MNKFYPYIELRTVDSTNLYSGRLLIKNSVVEGTIIFAHEQTSGKGQGDNTWESEPGQNATFSFVLFPDFLQPEKQFLLNKAISLGVTDFLLSVVVEQKLSIKWPNDIYAGNRKIGGILIQNTICGTKFKSCIAGVGLNINQEMFNPGLPNPVSLKQLTGKDYNVKDAVYLIAACIDERYQQLKRGDTESLGREYQDKLLWINEWKNFSVNKKLIKGKIKGVDEFGILVFEIRNGTSRYFHHGEIEFVFT
jgi:BirA family biotin operon repressor/biotin-[acetyl-CoA-carboxylase] ligase